VDFLFSWKRITYTAHNTEKQESNRAVAEMSVGEFSNAPFFRK